MNEAGIKRAEQLAHKEFSAIEYRNKLVRMQNMDCICHCSAEIDMGTLLYFSVNDMYLGQGYFVILLFSEVSSTTTEQQEGRDVFGRMFTYAVIEEIAVEAFTGHYAFYSSELDGRLVMILNFPFGLLPDRSIVHFLDENCREVAERCKELYDMDVVSYVGDPIDNIHFISAIYSKLLEMATLHRYTNHHFDDPVYHVPLPPAKPIEKDRKTLQDHSRDLFMLLSAPEELHAAADHILADLRDQQPNSIDTLKQSYGTLFETLCTQAKEYGVKMKYDKLREAQFHILFNSVRWEEPVDWMHHFLDQLCEVYTETVQNAARYQFSKALQYIDAALSDPDLNVDKCAQELGYTVSSLSKAFRRLLNTSAAKYIRDKRLEAAWELLRSGCSVADTCVKCGFGSVETFHRAFKAKYNITPGQLRRRGHN